MMAQRPLHERPLHEVLDGLLLSHRKDIKAFSGGHLNEANLPKPPDKATHKTWRSAKKPDIRLKPHSQLVKSAQAGRREDKMVDTIMYFSMGTSTKTPARHGNGKKTAKSASRHPVHVERQDSAHSQGSYSKRDDGMLVEEINMSQTYQAKPSAVDDVKHAEKPPSQGHPRDLLKPTYQTTPNIMQAVTKKDQFGQLKEYEAKILRKQDCMEQNVLSGMKAVEQLEVTLHQELSRLDQTGCGQGFNTLQVYSECLDDLIMESPTFGYILKTIKMQYDDYVAILLDSQLPKHQVLYEQVEKLSKRGTSNPQRLHKQTSRVQSLEKQAQKLLHDNDRLRKELAAERSRAVQAAPTEPLVPASHLYSHEPAPVELSRQVEQLHNAIMSKLDELTELRTRLRKEFVPSTVCTHLEQCIKETEVEIQKLASQKDYFERSTADMEQDLEAAIGQADTTERDARRVWKRIAAVKSPNNKQRGADDSDDESDSEIKWTWYIS